MVAYSDKFWFNILTLFLQHATVTQHHELSKTKEEKSHGGLQYHMLTTLKRTYPNKLDK